MSPHYKGKRKKNFYKPEDSKPFKLSRSKLEDFVKCPRCFYIDRRLGVGQVQGPPFNINTAIDHLLKKEFDEYRESAEPHPLMRDAGIDAVPCAHEKLDVWRENFKGVQVQHEATNLSIAGAIDDLWVTPSGQHIVVDYKATSKDGVVSLDAPWQDQYKRQMEIYQWLLRGNGLEVSNTGYFVYCNGRRSEPRFNQRVEFDISVIPYDGNDSWVDSCITDAHACLVSEDIPTATWNCDYCTYYSAVTDVM